MANICMAVATNVVKYLVEPAIREAQYFLCLNNVINDLENEKEALTSERDDLLIRIARAKERAEEIEKPVEKWLNDVENILKEAEDLEQRMDAQNNCFHGWCPTWRGYLLCRQMAGKTAEIGKLKGNSNNIQPFSYPAPLPGIQYHSSENFTYFESTKVAYNQLLAALQDDGIYMIGVYGMGGSGKTTLVTEVGKKVDGLKLFDEVISITMSQTPNIRDIQDKIAEMLNFKLNEKNEETRAQRLWLSLKEKKRVLIIVDDLWGEFNLMKIGICLDNDNKGAWKILVATRNQHVCTSMDCQKKIHLRLLSDDESWILFQKHAKIDDELSRSFNCVPQKLCDECKGLPIAIRTVGSSLKGKDKIEWELALDKLRDSDAFDDHEEGVRAALSCLKLSYDYLKNKNAELLFLMCSFFPEDYSIPIEYLIRYAIGLGVEGRSLKSTRNLIQASITKLLDSCLLMRAKESQYVKMHDMVRDTALWIAKGIKNRKILVNVDKPLSNLTEDDSIIDCFMLSSWYDEEDQIFRQLHAPNLEILLLSGSLNLSHATFDGIGGLKIFSLIHNSNYCLPFSLPPSSQLLTNLQTLRLKQRKLGDISFITSLTRLEVLDLECCILDELPNEMGKLKRLKLLDLSNCEFLQENYNGAIGKCSQLEELYVLNWDQKEYLAQTIEDIITLPKLQRFAIYYHTWDGYYATSNTRLLNVFDFNTSKLGAYKKNLFQIAEFVSLSNLRGGCKNIIPDMVGVVGDMNCLTSLRLDYCQEIECIFDTTSDSVVDSLIPKLVELVLLGLENLTELVRGPSLQVLSFFERLEKLEIEFCKHLHNIFPWECNLQNLTNLRIHYSMFGEALFSMSVAQSLQQLEVLNIDLCGELKHIISNERKHGSTSTNEIVPAPPLTTSHIVMPRLKKLYISCCWELESIFPICCVEGLTSLEDIEIVSCRKLKLVFGQCDHHYHSSHLYQNHNTHPYLKNLVLSDLENLVRLCPENNRAQWPSSTNLFVSGCPKLSASWIATMAGSEKREKFVQIEELGFRAFSGLSLISRVGPAPGQILSLQCLRHLKVSECENLKSLFSLELHRSLPELISICIEDCQELEQIIAENEELVQLPNVEVCFPKLTDIRVENCNKLKSLFSVAMVRMLPQLSRLEISMATQLEEIFRDGTGDHNINESEIVLPNLTKIKLKHLPSFVDICKVIKLQAVKLNNASIFDCPKIAPSFREIQVQLRSSRRR